jgi:hypothetical protein
VLNKLAGDLPSAYDALGAQDDAWCGGSGRSGIQNGAARQIGRRSLEKDEFKVEPIASQIDQEAAAQGIHSATAAASDTATTAD